MPARAEKAAEEADVLPVEEQIQALDTARSDIVTATVMPRSLNEPVGFMPSHLA